MTTIVLEHTIECTQYTYIMMKKEKKRVICVYVHVYLHSDLFIKNNKKKIAAKEFKKVIYFNL